MVGELLRHAFGASYLDIDHEPRLPKAHGRADMPSGATLFASKRDLRRELPDVLARLPE